jgi:membrane protease YdiL (CAAX protease family)
MNSIIKRNPLIAYYIFALLLSGIILAILCATGLAEKLFFLGTFGPGLAAILVTALISGGVGIRKLLGSLLIWRVGIQWWLVALFLPALIYLVAVYLISLFGGPDVDLSHYQPLYTIIPIIIMVTLLNGVGEELGWRGFMLPRCQSRYNALVSSLIVGFFWGLWRAPVYFIDGTAQSMLRSQVGIWMGLLLFTLSTIAISVTYTWLFNNTRGSVLIAAFLHGANNAWINYFLSDPATEVLGIIIWSTVLWVVIAILLILILGPAKLSHSAEKQVVSDGGV